jgi:CubicO group peptidase (beta-lactamase class C family)
MHTPRPVQFMRRHRLAAVLLAAAPAWSPAIAQQSTPDNAQAAKAPASAPGLEARLAWLSDRLEASRAAAHIPGMAIAVVKDDRIIFAKGFGLRNVEKNQPATPDTIFGIGSSTKAFTAMLCAMLVEEGKMKFDDPVTTYLPDFKLKTPEWTASTTMRDALSHRTGLARTDMLWAGNTVSRSQAIEQLRNAEPFAPPRTAFLYSNLMFMVAGDAAARTAGAESWERMVADRIFTPLGMSDTTARTAEARDDPRRAIGYRYVKPEAAGQAGTYEPLPMRTLDACGPAGSINSTVLDMTRWVRFLLNKGQLEGRRLVEAGVFDRDLWSPQMGMQPGAAYGLGWMLDRWRDKRQVHHGGNIDGYAAMVALLPEEGAGLILLSNVSASPLQEECKNLTWTALFGSEADLQPAAKQAAAMSEAQLAPYLGRYDFALQKSQVTALIKDGRLALDVPGQTVYTLKWPDQKGRWVFELTDAIEIDFQPGDDGVMKSMTLYQAGQTFVMPRVTGDAPTAMSVAELSAIVAKNRRGPAPRTFRLVGEVNFVHQGLAGPCTIVADGEKFRMSFDLGKFGHMTLGYDGEHAYSDSTFEPSRVLKGQEAAQARATNLRSIFEDPATLYEKVEPVAIESIRKTRCVKTKLTPAGAPATTVWIDTETGRPVREEQMLVQEDLGMSLSTKLGYTDYKPLGNVEFPSRITMENQFQGRMVLTFTTMEADVAIDPSEFALPLGAKR